MRHDDPAPLARAAAVRSARERDVAVRDRARSQTPGERLGEGLRLSRFAGRLAARRPSR
ncbi:MAG: hypothetical protein QOK31_1256 [Solirubrobacteraceae bacterium]|nr:hypothetical protein [Solirubrobacteraceae bacterium]